MKSLLPWKLMPSLDLRQRFGRRRIPEDLEDAVNRLNARWKERELEILKGWTEEDAIGRTHFGMGVWMRNKWGLWGDSRLAKYFRGLGIHQGDDMSAIIVASFYRRLNNREIALEEQVAFYRRWWQKRRVGPSYADCLHLRCLDSMILEAEAEDARGTAKPSGGTDEER